MWKREACLCKVVLIYVNIISNACTTNVNVGPVIVVSGGHIQVFAARVMVLNNVFATGVKMLMVFRLVMVVSATPATAAGRSDNPLRSRVRRVVPLVNIRS